MRGAVGKVLSRRLRRVGGRRSHQAARGDEARHDHQDDGHRPDTRAPGHGGQGHRTVFRRPSRGTAASWQRPVAMSGTAPGGICTHQDRVLNAHGSAGSTCSDNGTGERLKGLRFDARCVRAASWTVPKRFKRSVLGVALQSGRCIRHRSGPGGWFEKLPIGLPLVVGRVRFPGIRGLLTLLWFRIWVRARKTDAVGMHGGCGFAQVGPDGLTGLLVGESLHCHRGCSCIRPGSLAAELLCPRGLLTARNELWHWAKMGQPTAVVAASGVLQSVLIRTSFARQKFIMAELALNTSQLGHS